MTTMLDVDGARFGVDAYVGGAAFTLDDAELGRLDADNRIGPIAAGWISLACDVLETKWTAGASRDDGVFTRYEAGVATLELRNVDGRYTPHAGPYGDDLSITTPVRFYAGAGTGPDVAVFTGTVEGIIARNYLGDPTVEITVVDGVVDLNTYDPAPFDPPVGAGETAEARVHRILDEAGWSAPRSVPAGGPPMAGLTFDQSAWTELRATLEAARWTVVVDGDGTLRVEPYPFDLAPPVTATWGPSPGQAQPADLELALDITQLRNMVDAARDESGAPVYTHTDDESIGQYGRRRSSYQLGLAEDIDVDEWAAWVVANSAVPQTRVAAMSVRAGLDTSGHTWDVLAYARLGDVWRIAFPDLHVDRTSWVRGWAHAIRADGKTWETLVVLSTGSLGQVTPGWWTLDHDYWGRLNAGNRLKIV